MRKMCAEMRIIMIGIIGAMDEEVAKIVEAMEIERRKIRLVCHLRLESLMAKMLLL